MLGKQIESGTPKSKASNRTLPLPDEVVDLLKAARRHQTEERLKFGEGYGSGEYVATDEAGMPYHPNLLTFRWESSSTTSASSGFGCTTPATLAARSRT